uniref:Retrovirus-related Pol polyprotein from transposon TNT 1-94 n=1 Tax=Cajanus cajan TaxID=3821 RepID=A0A151RLV1_CAJCA|nr:Retrovirus-related Pol polyprotein from transposon TNT 1-94 [Cajanus cajan]
MAIENTFMQPSIPKFDSHYDHWEMLMENFLHSKEYWGLVKTGILVASVRTTPTEAQQCQIDENKVKDLKVKNYLFQALDRSIIETILKKDTTKDIWNFMKSWLRLEMNNSKVVLIQHNSCKVITKFIMMIAKSILKSFWPEAVNWVVHVVNRSPTLVMQNKTPEEAWGGKKPFVRYFKVFGCVAHVHVGHSSRTKLYKRSVTWVLLGVKDEEGFAQQDEVAQQEEAREQQIPKRHHTLPSWMQDYRVKVMYLKGTCEFGLFYQRNGGKYLIGYMDCDYVNNVEDRKNTSGYVFMMSGVAISWSPKKQLVVDLSTIEAKFLLATTSSCQAVWLRPILEAVGGNQTSPIVIYCDDSSTTKLSKNPVMHGKSKHIDVHFHFLRDLTRNETVELQHCSSQEQVVDVMTKPLKLEDFFSNEKEVRNCHKCKLNMCDDSV